MLRAIFNIFWRQQSTTRVKYICSFLVMVVGLLDPVIPRTKPPKVPTPVGPPNRVKVEQEGPVWTRPIHKDRQGSKRHIYTIWLVKTGGSGQLPSGLCKQDGAWQIKHRATWFTLSCIFQSRLIHDGGDSGYMSRRFRQERQIHANDLVKFSFELREKKYVETIAIPMVG